MTITSYQYHHYYYYHYYHNYLYQKLKTKQAGVALVQFGADREGASECHRTVMLDRQWDSLEEIRSLTRISQDVGQSVAQLGEECDAGCVDGTEGLQSQWLKNVILLLLLLFIIIIIIIIIII